MNAIQQTIKKSQSLSGVGLHTGKPVTVTFLPAPTFHGIKFQRTDLPDQPIIEADADFVVNTARSTTIEKNGVRVVTIEHLLSAAAGMEIDNLLVQINGEELPILDGSAIEYTKTLTACETAVQDQPREIFELSQIIEFEDPSTGTKLLAMPSDQFKVTVMIDYNSQLIGPQHATLENIEEYNKEIAACRTFVFLHELEQLAEANLIKGGDVDNAIVLVDRMLDQAALDKLALLFNKKDIRVDKEGILNNIQLKYQNEPARHKLLDIVGDMSLVGMPIKAQIIATRPGHKANTEFAKKIKAHIKKIKNAMPIPAYNPSAAPLYDIQQIKGLLPHRYPFLLVDKIIHMNDKEIVGIKNVTFNENFFPGHFPENPVMPGVLQIEAMAQCGGILALQEVKNPETYDTYFLKIDKAKFKRKVVPGDTLIMKIELLGPIRRGIAEMRGTIFVGDSIACEAEMMARIIKKEVNNG
jgi:UDP-3-O-[3-hydroxymyristoyl] N-acetylglucosamine deacetylase/3-hydroxyacyl-[acyl-carrier-protein] dehydratase